MGSAISVAALAEGGVAGVRAGSGSAYGNTFGAAAVAAGARDSSHAPNSAIPLWSLGSATAPGMTRADASGVSGVRTNTSAAAVGFAGGGGGSSAGATLLSFGGARKGAKAPPARSRTPPNSHARMHGVALRMRQRGLGCVLPQT